MRQDAGPASHEAVISIGHGVAWFRREKTTAPERKGGQKDWGLAEDITDFIFSILLVHRGEDRRGWVPLVLVNRISNLFLEGKNHEDRSAQTVRWRINEGPHGWSYELGTGKPHPPTKAGQTEYRKVRTFDWCWPETDFGCKLHMASQWQLANEPIVSTWQFSC
jgi:hypothetical protein